MIYKVSVQSKKKKKFLEQLMQSYVRQLKLENSKHQVVVMLQPDDVDITLDGYTVPSDDPNITLVVLPSKAKPIKMALALAHEMVHVKQLAKGQLKIHHKGYTWRGKAYPSKTPYAERPWEVEAYAKQEHLMQVALEG